MSGDSRVPNLDTKGVKQITREARPDRALDRFRDSLESRADHRRKSSKRTLSITAQKGFTLCKLDTLRRDFAEWKRLEKVAQCETQCGTKPRKAHASAGA